MWFKRNWLAIASLLFLSAVLGCSLITYRSVFNSKLSTQVSDWGAFGSYMSGTVGITIAFLAVIWLIYSVTIQRIELSRLKSQLEDSGKEQRKQTEISALTALINSYGTAASVSQQKLNACNDGTNHFLPNETAESIKEKMQNELKQMQSYTNQLESIRQKRT